MRRQKVVRLLSPIFLLALIFGLASVFVSVSKAQQDSTSEPEAIDTKALIKEVSEIVLQPEDVVEERLDFKNVSVITEDCNYLNSLDYVSSCAKLTDDIAVAYFDSTADTAKAFLELREHYGGDKILLDHAIKTETLNTYVGYNVDEYYGWGSLESTGLLEYANEIANSGNNTTLKVAVIDTGINASHIAFDNEGITRLDTESGRSFVNLAGGDNEVLDDNDPYYQTGPTTNIADDDGHGTAVSGIIAESTPNNVKIVPMKVGPVDSEGNLSSNATLFSVKWVIDHDLAQVINMSLGHELYHDQMTDEENAAHQAYYHLVDEQLMKRAYDKNIIVVTASGNEAHLPNDGDTEFKWPAECPYAIAIGSIDENRERSFFSNYGEELDFVAPGENIYVVTNLSNTQKGGKEDASGNFVGIDGTSLSAPYVSAAVANILLENPTYTFDQVYNELRLNSIDLGTPGFDNYYGYGAIDFHVNRLADITFSDPSFSTTSWTNQDVTATVSATTGANSFTGYTFSDGDKTKTIQNSWETYSDNAMTQTISQNGTYTMWLKNSDGETKAQVFTVSNIDKVNPSASDINYTSISGTSGTLTATVSDEDSGIMSVSAQYCTVDSDCETVNLSAPTTGNQWSAELDNLTPGHPYTVTVAVEDNAGNTNSLSGNFDTAAHTDHGGDSGNTGDDSGNTGDDSGNTGGDSGNTGGESGNTGGDSGNTGDDSGNTGGDSGNTGGDSGNTGGDSGNTGGDSGNTGGNSENTGNNDNTGNNTDSDNNSDKNTSSNNSPNTGDNKNKFLFLGLGSFTLVGTGAFVAIKKRR